MHLCLIAPVYDLEVFLMIDRYTRPAMGHIRELENKYGIWARYVTEMVRRIAALVLMQPELDANCERVKADVWKWER